MRSELMQFIEGFEGEDAEFQVRYEGDSSVLTDTGRRGRLTEIATFVTSAGASYRLAAGVIHRVEILARPCVSVLRTYDRGIPIFSYGRDSERPFERRRCTSDEADAIRQLLISGFGPVA